MFKPPSTIVAYMLSIVLCACSSAPSLVVGPEIEPDADEPLPPDYPQVPHSDAHRLDALDADAATLLDAAELDTTAIIIDASHETTAPETSPPTCAPSCRVGTFDCPKGQWCESIGCSLEGWARGHCVPQ